MDMLDSLMHDDLAGLHAVTGDRGEGLIRDRIGDRRRVDNHGNGFFGNLDQVNTCPDCHQVSCRGAARNEHEKRCCMDHPEGCLIIVFFNTGDNLDAT